MRRYARLYLLYIKSHFKVMMEYRLDFLLGILSVFFQQFAALFFLTVVFSHIETLKGWDYYEILFIYGIAFLGRAIHHIFFDNLWTLGWRYIRTGNLDRVLLRPVNPLFQIVAERLQQDGFGQLLIGGAVLYTASLKLAIDWGVTEVIWLVVFVLSSGALYIAINLFFATLSFWMTDSLPIVSAVFSLSDFARYPMAIYSKVITFILTFIIPYGFTAFYPATFFFEGKQSAFALATPLVAGVSLVIAYRFWTFGLQRFASTGT
ncbi:ABC transporter permease [Exiguobacterium flavidum]|uniref:ABC transporter permease n=1 Tax=Exiguobacterium flavidum TaxID=2184695 RepID=UPI000DF778AB|nr:ABC-2 family transporter protein [Exiguobacterium flavidum]